MTRATAKLLATRKGFEFCDAQSAGQHHLFDNLTGLPAINLQQGITVFTIKEAVEFLNSLVDRRPFSEA